MIGSHYSILHAFGPILWCMLGDKSQNVALASTTFISIQVEASKML